MKELGHKILHFNNTEKTVTCTEKLVSEVVFFKEGEEYKIEFADYDLTIKAKCTGNYKIEGISIDNPAPKSSLGIIRL